MKETGIIMSGNHPKLILDGIKTQTRRTYGLNEINKCPDEWEVIKQPVHWSFYKPNEPDEMGVPIPLNIKCPYGQVGDRLWVRETWALAIPAGASIRANRIPHYRADGVMLPKWKPSIHMFRKYSRITLEITEVRVERVQEISNEDAVAEGVEAIMEHDLYSTNLCLERIGAKQVEKPYPIGYRNYQYRTDKRYHYYNPHEPEFFDRAYSSFKSLWDSLNAKRGYGWDVNPYCWVISFKVV